MARFVAAVVPCTLASASVWTRKAGGDDSISMMTTVVTNLACLLVVPIGVSLVLAETSALVAERCPEDLSAEKKKQWQQLSVNVHKHGADLYRALGKKDFDGSKKHFGLMMDNCNKCHAVFDNGKHQLDK